MEESQPHSEGNGNTESAVYSDWEPPKEAREGRGQVLVCPCEAGHMQGRLSEEAGTDA